MCFELTRTWYEPQAPLGPCMPIARSQSRETAETTTATAETRELIPSFARIRDHMVTFGLYPPKHQIAAMS